MKRSKMLELIHKKLGGLLIAGNWEEQLLATIEELGMLPPTITILKNSYNRTDGTYGFEVNEWEPEDE